MKIQTGIKQRQERMTFEDTREYYSELVNYVFDKLSKKEGINNRDDYNEFMELFERGILSHGIHSFVFPIKNYGVIDFKNFGNFVTKFARASMFSNDNFVFFTDPSSQKTFKVPVIKCWFAILDALDRIKPYALNEGMRMSAEKMVRETSSSYEFSANK